MLGHFVNVDDSRFVSWIFSFCFFFSGFQIIGPTGYIFSLQTVFLHAKNVSFCFVFFFCWRLCIQNVSASIYESLHSLIVNHLGSLSCKFCWCVLSKLPVFWKCDRTQFDRRTNEHHFFRRLNWLALVPVECKRWAIGKGFNGEKKPGSILREMYFTNYKTEETS